MGGAALFAREGQPGLAPNFGQMDLSPLRSPPGMPYHLISGEGLGWSDTSERFSAVAELKG